MDTIKKNINYRHIDSMCGMNKIEFVYNFTKKNTLDEGIIVEIGTFYGAITQALRLGCIDNNKKIVTCDFFKWDKDKSGKFPHKKYKNEESFFEEVKLNLSHLPNIEIIQSNFTNLNIDKKICLMFVDAPKRNKYVINFITIFSPLWIPNKTKILFEDYNQFLSYELPATLFPIQQHFDFYTDKSKIVVAEFKKEFFKKEDMVKMNIREWKPKEIINNWNKIIQIGDNNLYLDINISIFMHLFDNGYINEAIKFSNEKKIYFEKYSSNEKFVKLYLRNNSIQKKYKKITNILGNIIRKIKL